MTTSEKELDYYHEHVNARFVSRIAEWLKTEDLRKVENSEKIPEMIKFNREYPAVDPGAEFWKFSGKNSKKSAVKHYIGKPFMLNFMNLSITFCPKLCLETDFYFSLGLDLLI